MQPRKRLRGSKVSTKSRRCRLFERLEPRVVLAAGVAVADFQFTNHGLNGQTELFSRDSHAASVASDISSPLPLGSTGNGEPPRGLALGGAFNETSEPTPANNTSDYFTFTIAPETGESLDLHDLSFSVRRNDPDSKNSFAVYFDEDPGASGDNFATKLFAGVVTSEDRFERFTVPLEGIAEFTALTQPFTFRYYAWGTEGVGTQRIDNVRVRAVAETVSSSEFAYYGDSGRLINPLDARGNRIADFSAAGYHNGERPIPNVLELVDASRVVQVAPVAGDDTAHIQAAIDQVAAMPVNASGFRGVVQLSAGEFQVSGTLEILESGILLQGAGDGDDPATSTILRGTGTEQRSLLRIGQASGFASGTGGSRNILDKYVPVGATSFRVDSTTNWDVGDKIIVRRPSTAEWIAALGMDQIPPRSDGGEVRQWQAGDYDELYERVITRIDGNLVHINAPLHSALDQEYGGGTAFEYVFPRIREVGVEGIRGVSDFASDTDEDHARTFIELQAVEDAWVKNVTGQHFVYATVHATGRSIRVTVDDAESLDPKSLITGARRYPFVIDGQFILMRNLYSEEGRHDFVNNSRYRNRGPNVFLDGVAVNSHSSTGPHQRFSTGTLYDTITTDNETEARNRGNFGSGHGWGGANMVFWNNIATRYRVQNPPTAQNWLIGSVGTIVDEQRFGPQPPPTVDAHGTPIDFGDPRNPTSSLYVAQRNRADDDNALGLSRREYVLGDFDLGQFDGLASDDSVFVDATWMSQVAGIAGSLPVEVSDQSTDGHVVPLSFEFPLGQQQSVFAAVLTLGLRGTGGPTADDTLYFDSLGDARTLQSLGASQLAVGTTTPLTVELTGEDLVLLDDGLLNLAISGNTALDWAHLDLRVGIQQSLSLDLSADTVRENGSVSGRVTIDRAVDYPVVVSLTSSNIQEASVPATVEIPAGQTQSAEFAILGVDEGRFDAVESVTITATAAQHTLASSTISVVDSLLHRTSELVVRVVDAEGNPVPDATVDVAMDRHAFKFGTQVRDRMFAITEAEFEALSDVQRQNLLPNLEASFGIPRVTPTWQDVLNYRGAVLREFNHVVPTTGMQWVSLRNNGPSAVDAALELAQDHGLTTTGASVVWQRDRWPTPPEFRSSASPDAAVFHDALIRDRLASGGVLSRFSDLGDGPAVSDWKLLNEPLHESYYADTFVAAGIYQSEVEALVDYFARARQVRPEATLSINEFNILNAPNDLAAIEYRDFVNDLLDAGASIDRIGVQAHISRRDLTKEDLVRRLDILAETGLAIEISEFDSRDDAGQLNAAQQQQVFSDLLEAAFEHPAVDGFIMWGVWDTAHWRGNAPLYDADWNVKDEAAPWFDLVRGEWMTGVDGAEVDQSGQWQSDERLVDGTYTVTARSADGRQQTQVYELTDDGVLTIELENPELFLSIAADSIQENGGTADVTLSRTGDKSSPLQVMLRSSDTGEATVPATVVIPAGQSEVQFSVSPADDQIVDGTQTATVFASATGYQQASDSILVQDDDVAALELSIEKTVLQENSSASLARVTRNVNFGDELIVSLSSSDTTEATVPATVLIPAGETFVEFQVLPVDDLLADGSQMVTIGASATGYDSDAADIQVDDNDEAKLILVVDVSRLDENGGRGQATIFRNTPATEALVVQLQSDVDERLQYPTEVTILPGESSASSEIQAIDNDLVDGDVAIKLTATANSHLADSETLQVTDDDRWGWTNLIDRLDVNNDGFVAPGDVLLIINYINSGAPALLPELTSAAPALYDVNADGFATPLDALLIINDLNSTAEGESSPIGIGVPRYLTESFPALSDDELHKRRLRWLDDYFADY